MYARVDRLSTLDDVIDDCADGGVQSYVLKEALLFSS